MFLRGGWFFHVRFEDEVSSVELTQSSLTQGEKCQIFGIFPVFSSEYDDTLCRNSVGTIFPQSLKRIIFQLGISHSTPESALVKPCATLNNLADSLQGIREYSPKRISI